MNCAAASPGGGDQRRERETDDKEELEGLKRANRFKSELLGVLAHELRNPLNIIVGSVELLLEGAFGSLTSEQAEQLQHAAKRAGDMAELLTAALDLSRAEAGQAVLDAREVQIVDLLREIETETRDARERRDIAFAWFVAPDLPAFSTDPTKLKIVLKNLVVNGLKFTERGGVTLDAHLREDGVEFCVADTGVGIPADALSVIFDAFRQVPSSIRHGGVGLGLYIVRRLLDIMGGHVTVDSTPGRGSLFRVWIPQTASKTGGLDAPEKKTR